MGKINNVPWEVLSILLFMILTIGITLGAGGLVFKLYRKFRPMKQTDIDSFDIINIDEKDSFLKLFLTGAIMCSPLYYLIYAYFSNNL